MDRKAISRKIQNIIVEISRLINALYALDTTDIQRYPDNYEVLSMDAALRAEKITCQLRNLIYTSTSIRKEDYLVKAADTHGIEICYEEGILEIKLDGLLPKKRQSRSVEFTADPFYFALSEYADKHFLPKFRECVVCFAHIYDRRLPERRIRDYDNLQQKQLLDILAAFIMVDDSGLLCDAYNTTELGEQDMTEILVMEKEYFTTWLEKRKKGMKSISDF